MSTISVGPSGAATVPAKAMISVRRGSLAAFAAAGLLVADRRGPAPRDERPPRRSDCVRPPGGRDRRGMVQRGALLAGSTPWQSTRSRPSRAGGRHGRDLASGSDPAAAPQHRCVGRLALASSRVLRHLRVPGGSCCESLRMGAARRDWRSKHWSRTSPQLLFSPVVYGQLAACRLQRRVSRERLHDRRSADDRRRFLQHGHLGVLPVRGLLRKPRLPDLPAGDGDAAAEAGTPACLRPGSDGHRFRSRSVFATARRAGARGCGPASRSGAGWPPSVTAHCPYGFLLSVVVSTFFAATALKTIVSRLVESPSASAAAHDAGRCTR